jgi:hypothetical protein
VAGNRTAATSATLHPAARRPASCGGRGAGAGARHSASAGAPPASAARSGVADAAAAVQATGAALRRSPVMKQTSWSSPGASQLTLRQVRGRGVRVSGGGGGA